MRFRQTLTPLLSSLLFLPALLLPAVSLASCSKPDLGDLEADNKEMRAELREMREDLRSLRKDTRELREKLALGTTTSTQAAGPTAGTSATGTGTPTTGTPATGAPTTTGTPATGTPATGPAVVVKQATVKIRVESNPRGAQVFLGDKVLGKTPLLFQTAASNEQLFLRIDKPGYQARLMSMVPTDDAKISVQLAKQ